MSEVPSSNRIPTFLYLLLLAGVISCSFFIPWNSWLEQSQNVLHHIRSWCDENIGKGLAIYALVYVTFTGFSLPGALYLTLIGAWLFGWYSLPVISFASTAGATMSCWLARWLLRDSLPAKYHNRWKHFQHDFKRFGWLYLLAMRLNPIIPFFLINLFVGLTRMPLWQFWLVSQVGMLPVTAIYVWIGSELSQVANLRELVSLRLLLALIASSLVPILLRWLIGRWMRETSIQTDDKPLSF